MRRFKQQISQEECIRILQEEKRGVLSMIGENGYPYAGFSFHDTPELLDTILTKYPEMEFVQLQINYLDWESG